MNSIKILKTGSIIVMLLGSIHLSATPVVFAFFNSSAEYDLSSIYMFVMVGVAVLFAGWLQYYLLRKLNDDKGYFKILVVSVIFLCIIGAGAAITLTKNPFAYISLCIALVEVCSLRSYLKNKTNV